MPPFETAKAHAFEVVLRQMEKHMGKSVWELIGEDKGELIAKHLKVKGGGHPSRNAVCQTIARCRSNDWCPGKPGGERTGRKPTVSQAHHLELKQVCLSLKALHVGVVLPTAS